MKKTGVVRKIDDLGRIVIPKEIRKNLNVNSGEDLEIYLDENAIILKKYHKILNFQESIKKYINIFNKALSNNIIITDNEKILITGNECLSIQKEKISKELYNILIERKKTQGKKLKLTSSFESENYYVIIPLVVNTDLEGSIIYIKDKEIEIYETQILEILKSLIINSIELE